MKNFRVHTQESASAAARETLSQVKAAFGFVPYLIGVMAESPPLAEAYLTLSGLFDKTTLSPVERQVVLLAASHGNACEHCLSHPNRQILRENCRKGSPPGANANRRLAISDWGWVSHGWLGTVI